MFIHFFCLCPLSLTVKLNFNISKVVYYTRFKGFLRNVWFSFQNLPKALLTFSPKRNSQKTFLILKFVIDTISNSDWTSRHTIQGVIVLIISNRPRASRLSDFEITRVKTP